MVVLQLSKQELIFGPMQIGARINQDQNISKDLTLWNQQGSQVLRGQILVLPVGNTFLYVDPIYIQATEARMPQLKKVVLAVGNRLVYADTYEEALAQLAGTSPPPAAAPHAQRFRRSHAAAPPRQCRLPRPTRRDRRPHPHAPAALSRTGVARQDGRGRQGTGCHRSGREKVGFTLQ